MAAEPWDGCIGFHQALSDQLIDHFLSFWGFSCCLGFSGHDFSRFGSVLSAFGAVFGGGGTECAGGVLSLFSGQAMAAMALLHFQCAAPL